MAAPTQVLIYYANDTGLAAPYERIIGWLRERRDDQYSKVADRVRDDLLQFPSAVDRDLGAVWRGIMAGGASLSNLRLMVLTNESVTSGKVYFGNADRGGLSPSSFTVPDFDREHFRLHPLSHPDVFALALRKASELFGVESTTFSLVTKSHGSERLALTSLFSAMLDYETSDEFFAEIDRTAPVHKEHFSRWLAQPSGAAKAGGLGVIFLGWYELGVFFLNELVNGIGTSKVEYLAVLQEASQRGMRFGSIVMESCDSHLDDSMVRQIPAAVDRIFTSKEAVPYSSIDYGRSLERCATGTAFATALGETLGKPFEAQSRR